MNKKTIVVDERWPEPARRLLGLVQQLSKTSKVIATRIVQEGGARVNGFTVRRPQTLLQLGDRLEIDYEPDDFRPQRLQSSYQPLEIRYEDEHLLVVDKPPHLLTVPTPNRERNTLLSLLQRRMQREHQAPETLCCVHRLDRGVSGLVVFAKGVPVAEKLRDQFAERKPRRHYLALVRGRMQADEGTYRSHLTTDKNLNRHSTDDPERGQLAITHFQVAERFDDSTLVDVTLETGRRNQIRVHFAEDGHPVLGDQRYGGTAAQDPRWPYRRIALHARTLGLRHPVTGETLEFESPWPPEFVGFVREAQRRSSPSRSTSGSGAPATHEAKRKKKSKGKRKK